MYKPLLEEKYIIDHINQLCKYREAICLPIFVMSDKNYAMGHAFSLHDTFMTFPVEKLKMTAEQCKKIYSDGSKRDLAASIFARSVQIVVDDIIDNNTYFKLPGLGRTQSYLYMKRTDGKQFKKAFKNGKWNDVDFIMSNFSGYQLEFKMESEKRLPRIKPVYLSGKYKQRIVDNTNQGKQY